MKKILILVAILAIALVVGLFIASKTSSTSQSLVKYSHPSGSFSFKYPSAYRVTEFEGAVLIHPASSEVSMNPLKSLATLQAIYYPNYMTEVVRYETAQNLTVQDVTLNGNTFKAISFPGTPAYGSTYIFSLEGGENPSMFLIGNVRPNTTEFSSEDFEDILETLTIDRDKMIKLAREQGSAMAKRLWKRK